ncbi:Uncharacterised protein [Mycobacteroides abscessus subsp. abscessus]|nr:Uncharacterised protein [Mycobacteroides abscessus subsp. abscessus]
MTTVGLNTSSAARRCATPAESGLEGVGGGAIAQGTAPNNSTANSVARYSSSLAAVMATRSPRLSPRSRSAAARIRMSTTRSAPARVYRWRRES